MADAGDKVEKNVAGSWYVDSNCIACGLCEELAADVFELDYEAGYAFVKKQPEGDEETEAAREAMEQCPTDAIGDDG